MTLGDCRVLVITGAGISADSGIATFRGDGGYWRSQNPVQLATRAAFERDADTVWQWYRERRRKIREASPNPAHQALVDLQRQCGEFLLVTQNVDDLDARAGMPAERMVQIHGRIFDAYCESCGHKVSHAQPGQDDQTAIPLCGKCQARLRPGVVWFDEELPRAEVLRVEWYLQSGPCDLVLVVGTTGTFDYIVEWAARARGTAGQLIEVNPDRSGITHLADRHIPVRASAALPDLVASLAVSRSGR